MSTSPVCSSATGCKRPGSARVAGPSSKAIGAAPSLLTVGRLETGDLVVEDGATVTAETIFIGGGAAGTAEVRGIAGATSSFLEASQALHVGVNASGTLRLSDRAGVFAGNDLFLGGAAPAEVGTIEILSGATLGALSVTATRGTVVVDGTAIVTNAPSLAFSSGDVTIASDVGVEVRNGGELNTASKLVIDGIVAVAGVTPLGTRSLIAAPFGEIVVGQTATAIFQIRDGGRAESVDASIHQGSDVFIFGNPTPGAVDWQIDHDLDVDSGTLQFCPGPGLVTVGNLLTLGVNGVIKGNGRVQTAIFVNNGTGSPSCSIGTLVVEGDYQQTPQGRLVVEAAGAGPGDVDVFRVTGATTLGGTLEVRFVDGYLPAAGDFLPFLDLEGAVDGAFARIVVHGVGEDLVLAPGVVGGVTGFTALTSGKTCSPGGATECEICDDCLDDDGDGLVDRADPDCAAAADGAGAGSGGDAAARKALGKCAAALAKTSAKLSALVAKRLQSCSAAVLACVQTKPGDAKCLAKAKAACAKSTAGLAPAGANRDKARRAIAKACGVKTPGAPPAVPLATLRAATGLGFDAEVARCAALATPVLASVDDVIACVDRATVCRAAALFATRVPRAAELLGEGGAEPTLLACLPLSTEDGGGLGDPKTIGKPLVKCQNAIAAAGAKLAARAGKGYAACAALVRACIESADPAACVAKAAAGCAKATRALPTVGGAADAKLLATLGKACAKVDAAALRSPDGLGFASLAARCAVLGVPALDGTAALASCLSREHACRSVTLAEAATPRLREHFSGAGLTIP